MAFLVILPFTAKHFDLVDILLVLTVYVLQVKIKFRLNFFNLDKIDSQFSLSSSPNVRIIILGLEDKENWEST